MKSTLQIGDGFRDAVADLLRTQFSDVATEQMIAGTKVDITFTDHHWGKSIICAVECKNYDTPLTKTDLEHQIFLKYEPMLQSKAIGRVIVVSRRAIGAAAEGYLEALPSYTHLTFEVLAEQLFGIRSVIEHLRTSGKDKSPHYIESRFVEHSESVFEAIDAWIERDADQALAILGGYGQGKTTLAVQLAAHAAEKYLADPKNRIPILLRLGEVVHETQLEGLFGKEFTARHNVARYRFDTLMHLNKLGRLLIILDGFDEMKHAMSAHDFESNFREFNRLLVGNAKVMLLGRPSALPSEERELVFRGRKRVGNTMVQSSHFKPWVEWKLAFFTIQEASQLLDNVLSSALQKEHQSTVVQKRIADVLKHVPHDLLMRPVHVVLIAEAAADLSFDFKGFDEHTLYSHFVREMVKRDQVDKRARREIPLEDRLSFQRELAWWSWSRAGVSQGSFLRDGIPPDLLESLPDGGATDIDSKRNEYIVSTLTDEKEAGTLYFSHRSFQEFLVAERMTLVSGSSTHAPYSRYMNPEIGNFVSLAPDKKFLDKWFSTLGEQTGLVGWNYLALFTKSSEFMSRLWEGIDPGVAAAPATLAIFLVYCAERKDRGGWPATYRRLLRDEIEAGTETSAAVAVFTYLSLFDAEHGNPRAAAELVASIIVRALNFASANKMGSQQAGTELLVPTKSLDFTVQWVQEHLKREIRDANRVLTWQIGTRHPSTLRESSVKHLLATLLLSDDVEDGWGRIPRANDEPVPCEVKVPIALVYQQIPEQARAEYTKFLNASDQRFKIVGTDRRGASTGRHKVAARYRTQGDRSG